MKKDRNTVYFHTSSMADIAFLLLIFFLVTTTIASDQGLPLVLPPDRNDEPEIEIQDRNVLAILVNSSDRVLVEQEELSDISMLNELVRQFVLNRGKNPEWSVSPGEAVVSIRTDRKTSQKRFIQVLDEVHEAYYLIYAGRLDIGTAAWKDILNTLNTPESRRQYNLARGLRSDGSVEYPMQISIAEPVITLPE